MREGEPSLIASAFRRVGEAQSSMLTVDFGFHATGTKSECRALPLDNAQLLCNLRAATNRKAR